MFVIWKLDNSIFSMNKGFLIRLTMTAISFCQALAISQYLNLSLSLRDRDRADTMITLPHHTTTENFLSAF